MRGMQIAQPAFPRFVLYSLNSASSAACGRFVSAGTDVEDKSRESCGVCNPAAGTGLLLSWPLNGFTF